MYLSTPSFPVTAIVAWLIIPKAGKIKMYTSGWPKNQKRCWYISTLPPPLASKKEVLRVRSNRSIVIPHAKTGRLKIKRKVVTIIVQTIKTNLSNGKFPFPFKIVDIKLKLATRLETPAMWRLKILRSTESPMCPSVLRGG